MLSNHLHTLKLSQLRHAAFLLGLPSSGTKPQLCNTLVSQLSDPISKPSQSECIVSIDMGIKNLGICVMEPLPLSSPTTSASPTQLGIKITDWKRLNLHPSSTDSTTPPDPTFFQPSNLSVKAVQTATSILSTYNPSTILIERQRFRSGGASAVQEWTLRVNVFESMLWAVLSTLRTYLPQNPGGDGWDRFPMAQEVLPSRVAAFWCNAPQGFGTSVPGDLFEVEGSGRKERSTLGMEGDGMESVAKTKRSVDKAEKIKLVHSWLTSGNSLDGTLPTNHDAVHLELSSQAQVAADEFLSKRRGAQKTRDRHAAQKDEEAVTRSKAEGKKKLDDLADSLLQAVAWMRWRENERIMRDVLRRRGLLMESISNG